MGLGMPIATYRLRKYNRSELIGSSTAVRAEIATVNDKELRVAEILSANADAFGLFKNPEYFVDNIELHTLGLEKDTTKLPILKRFFRKYKYATFVLDIKSLNNLIDNANNPFIYQFIFSLCPIVLVDYFEDDWHRTRNEAGNGACKAANNIVTQVVNLKGELLKEINNKFAQT